MNSQKAVVQSSSGRTNNKKSSAGSFLEALKEQAKAASLGVVKTGYDQVSGAGYQPAQENQQNQFNFQDFLKSWERQARLQERTAIRNIQISETIVFHHKEEAAKQQIELIKKEIKCLASHIGGLSSEIVQAQKAVSGELPDAKTGIYYISFFERVKRLLVLARKKITESRTWLQEFASRGKAQSFYRQQANNSGTKFTLSSERTMATQVG